MGIEFNPRQRQAIEHVHGPMLVIAGAGTGKTTVLVNRIARLIEREHARPDEILAVTYTRNAAEEMRSRVATMVTADLSQLQAHTFHDYCQKILQRNGEGFEVLDDCDLYIYLRRRIAELPLRHFIRGADLGEFLHDLAKFFNRCHDELVGVEDYERYVERLGRGDDPLPRVGQSKHELSDEVRLERCEEIANVYRQVEAMLASDGLGTFAHMITRAVRLLRSDSALLQREQAAAKFILLDEFQDANYAQIELARLLGGEAANVFAVGDPDQAIYNFRGASSRSFARFRKVFPGGTTVRLIENQRSLSTVLKCAFAVIQNNPDDAASEYRREELVSAREQAGKKNGRAIASEPVQVVLWPDQGAEAAAVAEAIQQGQQQSGKPWNQFVVLYRNHGHREEIAYELAMRGIPFAVTGMDVRLTTPVRDLFACLAAVIHPRDAVSALRVASLTKFKLDPEAVRDALASAREQRGPDGKRRTWLLEEALASLPAFARVRESIGRLRGRAKAKGAADLLDDAVKELGLDAEHGALKCLLKFVKEWSKKRAITRTGDLADLLDYLNLFEQAGGRITAAPEHEEDAVQLMTVHAAKGKEWPHVWVLRCCSPSFPTNYREPLLAFPDALNLDSLAPQGGSEAHREEERRLFYVAMTRARDTLTLCAKPGRSKKIVDPIPSAFLQELAAAKAAEGAWVKIVLPPTAELQASATAQPVFSSIAPWLLLPPKFERKRLTLSARAIDTYERCPLRFKIERDWNLPSEAAPQIQFGNVMHEVLREYYAEVLRGKSPTIDQVGGWFDREMAKATFDEPRQQEQFRLEGWSQLQTFVRAREQAQHPRILAVEQSFKIDVNGISVNGRIDRIDDADGGTLVVTDYKTGKPKAQRYADESLQLSVYALAAKQTLGRAVSACVIHNTQDDTQVWTERSPVDLENVKAKIQQVADAIAAGEFPSSPGRECDYCAYHDVCPETERQLVTLQTQAAKVSS